MAVFSASLSEFERAAIDAAVHASHTAKRLSRAHHDTIAEIVAGAGYDESHDVGLGVVVPEDALPTWDERARGDLRQGMGPWSTFETAMSEDRYAQVLAGADPTPEELLEVARTHVDRAQDEQEYADACFNAWASRVEASDGRVAWWLGYVRGYSFSDPEYDDDGVFPDLDAAIQAVRRRGLTSSDEVTLEHALMMFEPALANPASEMPAPPQSCAWNTSEEDVSPERHDRTSHSHR